PPAAPPPTAAADRPGPDFADLVTRLEARMKVAPGDPRGWRLLGWSYMRMGRYGEAAVAYGRAGALDPASAEYPSARGEALTAAAGGQVGPAARAAFTAALARNGADPRARYFLALARDQHGDHAGAMTAWIALLKSAPPGAPWAADVRGFVVRIARQNGEDIAGKLPPAPAADRVAPSLAMSAADRRATIEAMVGRLAARLKANPRDADGWARLMRARMVLGETAAAVVAYRDALAAFADSPADQAALRRRAEELAVPGTQARG
ncbi:MAG: TPR domain-containing protein, partial [Caulobacteraceae bacterium]